MVKIMLKEIRTKRKITLRQLEATSGISISTLSRIEKGQVSPTLFEEDIKEMDKLLSNIPTEYRDMAKGFMIAMQIKDEKSMNDKPEKVG
jgi:transcriptional regulator with XRE-family HTH domain